jgi:hypothetical protein
MKRVSASRNRQLPIYGLRLVTAAKVSGKTPVRPLPSFGISAAYNLTALSRQVLTSAARKSLLSGSHLVGLFLTN